MARDYNSIDIDEMEGGTPENMSRTARMQRRIATALIRPTSASTGEQRNRLYEHTDTITPDSFSKSIESDNWVAQSRDKKLTDAMGKMEYINKFMPDAEGDIVKARQQNPQDLDRAQAWAGHLQQAYSQTNDTIKELSTPREPSQTSKHLWMAALLGKHAVGHAISDQNDAMGKEVKTPPYVDYETTGEPATIWTSSHVGEAKATHRANTRTLTRGQRLKERIAPYRAVVHEVNDAYGGPEEGGWTYETGTPVHTSRGFVTKRGAQKEVERLKTKYTPVEGGRSILSMSPSDVYDMDRDQGVFEPLEYTDNYAKAHDMPSRFTQEPLDEDYDYSHFGQPSRDYKVNLGYGKLGPYPKRRPYYE